MIAVEQETGIDIYFREGHKNFLPFLGFECIPLLYHSLALGATVLGVALLNILIVLWLILRTYEEFIMLKK